MRVEIGRVCEKGPHSDFQGGSDYGSCGSHYYATIYVEVEQFRANPRGETYTAEEAATVIKRAFAEADAHSWCNYDPEEIDRIEKEILGEDF